MKITHYVSLIAAALLLSMNVQGQDETGHDRVKDAMKAYGDKMKIEYSIQFLLDSIAKSDNDANALILCESENTDSILNVLKVKFNKNWERAEAIGDIVTTYTTSGYDTASPATSAKALINAIESYIKQDSSSRSADTIAVKAFLDEHAALSEELESDVKDLTPTIIVQTVGDKGGNGGGENPPRNPEQKAKIIKFAIILLIGLLVVALIIVLYVRYHQYEAAKKKEYEQRFHDVRDSYTKWINDMKTAHSSDVNSLTKRIDSLERTLNELSVIVYKDQGQAQTRSSQAQQVQAAPVKRIETYYLGFPDKSGFFWNSSLQRTAKNDTPFILEIDPSNKKVGQLSFDTSKPDSMRNAIANIDTFLKPVCNISGSALSGDRIRVTKKGLVELRGEQWFISDGNKMEITISN
jgi:ABC-type cobalt transport system substrate-binding protein